MGYPTLPSRSAFGPTMRDNGKVTNPETQIAAAIFNLLFHQVSGMGLVSPTALLFVDATGASATTTTQRLAWDPTGALSLLVWVRTGTGVYTCQLAANYLDEQGTSIATNLKAGKPWVTEANDKSAAYAKMLSVSQVEVRTYNAAGAAADLDFAVPLFRG